MRYCILGPCRWLRQCVRRALAHRRTMIAAVGWGAGLAAWWIEMMFAAFALWKD